MSSISITRRNPKTGKLETPFKDHGWYVLGDPTHRGMKHHKKFALRVRTLEEVLDLVCRGFSVRMSAGPSTTWPPLIAPKSLTIHTPGATA